MSNPILSLIPQNRARRDLVGFDLDDDYMKIAHVRITSLKREVSHLAGREVRGMSDEDISSFIHETLETHGLKNPKAFIAVPLHLVITRSIEIPSLDPQEIREIVNLQASRHTPYTRAEIIIDMLDLGVVRESYTKVLLVIVPKEVVSRQIKIVEGAGLKLEKVFFSPEGICQAFSKIANPPSQDASFAVIHMDSAFTSFMVMQKNRILFVRGIPVGANHLLDEREMHRERFAEELQKSLESYMGDEIGPSPKVLYLTGAAAEHSELDEIFSDALNLPTRHQAYFNYFAISAEARQVASAAKRLSYFNLIAPLLLYDRMRVDLTSEEKKLKIELEHRAVQMFTTGILCMTILSLLFASFVSKLYFKNEYSKRLMARYQPVINDAKDLEFVFGKTRVIKEYLSNRGHALETLSEVYETTPPEIKLSGLHYEDEGKFAVKGTSTSMASVFGFVTNLEKSKKFNSVKTKYVTNRNDKGVDVADFEIECLIDTSGKVEA